MLKTVLDHQKTTVKSEGSVCCAEVGSVCAEFPAFKAFSFRLNAIPQREGDDRKFT